MIIGVNIYYLALDVHRHFAYLSFSWRSLLMLNWFVLNEAL